MFSSPQPLLDLVRAQKSGQARGLPSACTAHRETLIAALEETRQAGLPLLVEATCNQVNQFGGYTGLTPADFAAYLARLCAESGLTADRVILGGDHLGPNPWRKEPAAAAMDKAGRMVADFARAGFCKLHLDASMACGDDGELPAEEVARRAARLCAAAEGALPAGAPRPVYVVGTEVPPPGGAKEGEELQVTRPADALAALELFRSAFQAAGLESAWERVIALVVQPGVEYGDASVHAYRREAAAGLSRAIEGLPGILYEAHSTDYQTPAALRELVEDHFAILKVGPGLTFAYREALFALAQIEAAWPEAQRGEPSRLIAAALETMHSAPGDWAAYYHGSSAEIDFAMQYSLSDRIRYYWLREPLKSAVQRLFANLAGAALPLGLLSQFMPQEYILVRDGLLENSAPALVRAHVRQVMRVYNQACGLETR